MLVKFHEKRHFGDSFAVNLVKTISNSIDVEKRFGFLVEYIIEKPYSKLVHPVKLSKQDIAVAQIMAFIGFFILTLLTLLTSPVIAILSILCMLATIVAPRFILNNIYNKQIDLAVAEIPVFLETFQIFLKYSHNTYKSFAISIESVDILAPYLTPISNNWGIDSEKYITEMQDSLNNEYVNILCRILRNLVNKNPEEIIEYFQFHSDRITTHIERAEEISTNKSSTGISVLSVLPYAGSLIVVILPFIKQIVGLL